MSTTLPKLDKVDKPPKLISTKMNKWPHHHREWVSDWRRLFIVILGILGLCYGIYLKFN